MATVRELVTRLIFRTEGERAAEQTGERVKAAGQAAAGGWRRFSAEIGLAITGLQQMGRVARGAFDAIVGGFVRTTDAQAKLSRGLGLQIQELQAWQFAAQDAGIASNDINAALGKLGRRIQDAVDGNKDARKAFRDLGVSLTDSAGKTRGVQDVMLQLADGFAKLGPGAKRTALSMKFFEESGAKFIPLLGEGADGLRKTFARFRELGGAVDQSGAKLAESFNRRLLEARTALTGVRNRIAVAVLPALTDLLKRFAAWASDGERVKRVTEAIKLAAQVLGSVLATLAAQRVVGLVASLGAWVKGLFAVDVASKRAALSTRLLAGAMGLLKATGILLIAAALQDLFKIATGGESVIARALGPEGAKGLRDALVQIGGIVGEVFRQLAPVLAEIIKAIAPLIPILAKVIGFIAKGLVIALKIVAGIIKVIVAAIREMRPLWEAIGSVAKAVFGSIKTIWDSTFGAIISGLKSIGIDLKSLKPIAMALAIPFKIIGAVIFAIRDAIKFVIDKLSDAREVLEDVIGVSVKSKVGGPLTFGDQAAAASAAGAPGAAPITQNNRQSINVNVSATTNADPEEIGRISANAVRDEQARQNRQALANLKRPRGG